MVDAEVRHGLPPRPASATPYRRPHSAARSRGTEFSFLDDFNAGLGRGTRGLGECTAEGDTSADGAGAVLDLSATTTSARRSPKLRGRGGPPTRNWWQDECDVPLSRADAAIVYYRAQQLDRWFDQKEGQLARERADRISKMGDDYGRKFTRKAVPHDWGQMQPEVVSKLGLVTRKPDRKRETMRVKMEQWREKREEDMQKAKQASAQELRRDLESAAAERERDELQRKDHRRWSKERRMEMVKDRRQRQQLSVQQRKEQQKWENAMLKEDKAVNRAMRESTVQMAARNIQMHRAEKRREAERYRGHNIQLVRHIRTQQAEKEKEKDDWNTKTRQALRDEMKTEDKRRRERKEKEKEEKERVLEERGKEVRRRKELMMQELQEQRDRDSAQVKADWRKRYIDGTFPPEVKDAAGIRMTAWDDRSFDQSIQTLRRHNQQMRGESPFSPRRARLSPNATRSQLVQQGSRHGRGGNSTDAPNTNKVVPAAAQHISPQRQHASPARSLPPDQS